MVSLTAVAAIPIITLANQTPEGKVATSKWLIAGLASLATLIESFLQLAKPHEYALVKRYMAEEFDKQIRATATGYKGHADANQGTGEDIMADDESDQEDGEEHRDDDESTQKGSEDIMTDDEPTQEGSEENRDDRARSSQGGDEEDGEAVHFRYFFERIEPLREIAAAKMREISESSLMGSAAADAFTQGEEEDGQNKPFGKA
ncbi:MULTISPECIES: hypothetical protein [unclassified Frankia]|uniref:hypothetical protein n=1 Tax=unclassified Frankia TaxID=2632575 RepID=UPI0010557F65|nr:MULTISPECIES: hypothetical protein [unclassified Frankia]